MIKTERFTLALWPSRECYIFALANPKVELLAMEKVRSGREKLSQQRNICRLLFCLSRAWHNFSFSISSSFLSFPPPSHPTGIFSACRLKMIQLNIRKKGSRRNKNARWKPPAQKVLVRVMRMWWNGKITWEWEVWTSLCQNWDEYV